MSNYDKSIILVDESVKYHGDPWYSA